MKLSHLPILLDQQGLVAPCRLSARAAFLRKPSTAILRKVLLAKKGKRASFNNAVASLPDVGTDDDFAIERDLGRSEELFG